MKVNSVYPNTILKWFQIKWNRIKQNDLYIAVYIFILSQIQSHFKHKFQSFKLASFISSKKKKVWFYIYLFMLNKVVVESHLPITINISTDKSNRVALSFSFPP